VTVTQDTLLVAVQLHPLWVVTLTLPVPPYELNDLLVGEIAKVQDIPCWVMVNVCPAIVRVPVLWLVDVLAETEYPIVPLPLPLLPEVIVIHDTLLVAVQEHPLWEVILTLPEPPFELNDWLVGEMV
jgi:hypothetical protein